MKQMHQSNNVNLPSHVVDTCDNKRLSVAVSKHKSACIQVVVFCTGACIICSVNY